MFMLWVYNILAGPARAHARERDRCPAGQKHQLSSRRLSSHAADHILVILNLALVNNSVKSELEPPASLWGPGSGHSLSESFTLGGLADHPDCLGPSLRRAERSFANSSPEPFRVALIANLKVCSFQVNSEPREISSVEESFFIMAELLSLPVGSSKLYHSPSQAAAQYMQPAAVVPQNQSGVARAAWSGPSGRPVGRRRCQRPARARNGFRDAAV
jgi:hypothetical protein